MIIPFAVDPSPRLRFGAGTVAEVVREVRVLGRRAALVVTDPGVVAAGVTDRVVSPLRADGVTVSVFSALSPSPLLAEVAAGTALARTLVDGAVVVAVGGGSAMDAAKAIALGATNDVAVQRLEDPETTPVPALPIVAVPTTAGTGSETNGFGVIHDSERMRKAYLGNATTLPAVAILDPALTLGVPPPVTAATGMDALTHALESLVSRSANPVASSHDLHALELVAANLGLAVGDGSAIEARASMLLAAHLAGRGLSATGLGVAHAIGHALSNRVGTPHGLALAMVLPEVLRYNLEVGAEAFAEAHDVFASASPTGGASTAGVDERTGSVEARAHGLVEQVQALSEEVGTARPLRSVGVEADLVEVLAADALEDPVISNNPRTPTVDDVAAIVAACR